MGICRDLGGAGVILLVSAGFAGVFPTDAFAVAVKVVDASAATSLAGTEVKFDLNDGDSVTTTVGQDATVNVPSKVTQSNVKACSRKVVTESGETKWEPIPCIWFLLPGDGAAATGSTGATSTAQPLGEWMHGTTLRSFVKGGATFANQVTDVTTRNFGSSFDNLDLNSGLAVGAGIQMVFPSGWLISTEYEYLQNRLPQQTSTEHPQNNVRTFQGGSYNGQFVAINAGYEWDCYKMFKFGASAGPKFGSMRVNTGGEAKTNGWFGYNVQAWVRMALTPTVSAGITYEHTEVSGNVNNQAIDNFRTPTNGTVVMNILQATLYYDFFKF